MPKKAGSHHVVLNVNGEWDVKKDGATRNRCRFDKKQNAVNAGRKISQNLPSVLVSSLRDSTSLENSPS